MRLILILNICAFALIPNRMIAACYYNHYIEPDSCAKNQWVDEDKTCPEEGTDCEVLCDEGPYLA